jgi:predicted adenylyl cyclase CyaB
MPLNLELKARLISSTFALRTAHKHAKFAGILSQTDYYYRVEKGRLKLRQFSRTAGELIYYNREEKKKDRWSRYYVYALSNPAAMKKFLDSSFDHVSTVQKKRRLFFYKNARIHIDTVKNLGSYIEFEVIVAKGTMQAKRLLIELIKKFEIQPKRIVKKSYIDLYLQHKRKH